MSLKKEGDKTASMKKLSFADTIQTKKNPEIKQRQCAIILSSHKKHYSFTICVVKPVLYPRGWVGFMAAVLITESFCSVSELRAALESNWNEMAAWKEPSRKVA